MCEKYKHPHYDVMGSSGWTDTCAKIKISARNGDLGDVLYETLPVLPKKLTETQNKSAIFQQSGGTLNDKNYHR